MSTFAPGEVQWIARLGDLRNTVRQELMRRQLAEHARSGMQVLDVGCGQGTQAIELARLGCHLTGVEPSAELRARCEASAADSGVVVRVLDGTIEVDRRCVAWPDDRRPQNVFVSRLLMTTPDSSLGIGGDVPKTPSASESSVLERSRNRGFA
jgi:SAM-dependent methyltransferase